MSPIRGSPTELLSLSGGKITLDIIVIQLILNVVQRSYTSGKLCEMITRRV